jgi:hypothetical protein
MNSSTQSPAGGPLEPLPTPPLLDCEAVPISPRDRSNAGILATLLSSAWR